MIIHRGAIYRVRLSGAVGHEQQGEARPCLVVHRQSLRNAGTGIVIPLTSQKPAVGYPLVVHLPAGTGGNPKECWAKITQIRVVSESRFQEKVFWHLSPKELAPVQAALREVLDL